MLSLLFSFRGRINRKQYWIGWAATQIGLYATLFACALLFLGAIAAGGGEANVGHAIIGAFGGLALYGLFNLAATVASMALIAKRLHDLGQSGFWCLLLLLGPSPLAMYSIFNAMTLSTRFGGQSPPFFAPGYLILLFSGLLMLGVVVLGCIPGQRRSNRYDHPPVQSPSPGSPPEPVAPVHRAPADIRPVEPSFGKRQTARQPG